MLVSVLYGNENSTLDSALWFLLDIFSYHTWLVANCTDSLDIWCEQWQDCQAKKVNKQSPNYHQAQWFFSDFTNFDSYDVIIPPIPLLGTLKRKCWSFQQTRLTYSEEVPASFQNSCFYTIMFLHVIFIWLEVNIKLVELE